jgi:hypothetical protein
VPVIYSEYTQHSCVVAEDVHSIMPATGGLAGLLFVPF